jgi:hypothetical protein
LGVFSLFRNSDRLSGTPLKIPLDENRFLQAGNGDENTKEKSRRCFMARQSCDCQCSFRYGGLLAEIITCLVVDGNSLAVKLTMVCCCWCEGIQHILLLVLKKNEKKKNKKMDRWVGNFDH